MSLNIRIKDFVNAREVDTGIVFDWMSGVPMTLQTLICERVSAEFERSRSYPQQGLPDFHPLVAWAKSADFETVYENRLKSAQEVALSGFRTGSFFVVVDGSQIEDLECELRLTPTSTVRFIRLVPLKGG